MILLLFAAAGLASASGPEEFPELGDSTRQNLAAMIVPPRIESDEPPGTDAGRAVDAVRRLSARKTPPLRNTATPPQLVWER